MSEWEAFCCLYIPGYDIRHLKRLIKDGRAGIRDVDLIRLKAMLEVALKEIHNPESDK